MWGALILTRLLTTAALYGGMEIAERRATPIHKQKSFESTVKMEDRVWLTDKARFGNSKK